MLKITQNLTVKKELENLEKMEEKEEHKQSKNKDFSTNYKFTDFKQKTVSDKVLVPLPRKLDQAYLSGNTYVRFLKEAKSSGVSKIIVLDRSNFSVYELNQRKTTFSHLFSSKMENQDKLIDWKGNPPLFMGQYGGRLILCSPPPKIENRDENDQFNNFQVQKHTQKLRYFKSNLKEAKEGEVLKLDLIGEVDGSSSFYKTRSIKSYFPFYLDLSFVNMPSYFLTKYEYSYERSRHRYTSYMVDAVGRKPQRKKSYTQSVFELLGWDFNSSEVLSKKIEEDKLLVDEAVRNELRFYRSPGQRISIDSIKSKTDHNFAVWVIRDHFFVIQIFNLKSRKILKTCYITVYEILGSLEPRDAKGTFILQNFDVYYRGAADRLYLNFFVDKGDDDPEDIPLMNPEEDFGPEHHFDDEFDEDDWEDGLEEDPEPNFGNYPREPPELLDESSHSLGFQNDQDGNDLGPGRPALDDNLLAEVAETEPTLLANRNNNADMAEADNINPEVQEGEVNQMQDQDNNNTMTPPADEEDTKGSKIKDIQVTISNVFNRKARKIVSKRISKENRLEPYDESRLVELDENCSHIVFTILNEKDGSQKMISINKRLNQLDSKLSMVKMIAKVDETKLIFADATTLYLVHLEKKIVIDRLQFCHLFQPEIQGVYQLDDTLLVYDKVMSSIEVFKFRKKRMKFVRKVDCMRPLVELGYHEFLRSAILAANSIDQWTILLSLSLYADSIEGIDLPNDCVPFLEICLLSGRVKLLQHLDLDEITRTLNSIELCVDKDGMFTLLDTDFYKIEMNPLDKNYGLLPEKKMSYTAPDYMSEYIYKSYRLLVGLELPRNEIFLLEFDKKIPSKEPELTKKIVLEGGSLKAIVGRQHESPLDYFWVLEEHLKQIEKNDEKNGEEGSLVDEEHQIAYNLSAYDDNLVKVTQLDLDLEFGERISDQDFYWEMVGGVPAALGTNETISFDFLEKEIRRVELDSARKYYFMDHKRFLYFEGDR